jgi:fused signal recognition particle receptor
LFVEYVRKKKSSSDGIKVEIGGESNHDAVQRDATAKQQPAPAREVKSQQAQGAAELKRLAEEKTEAVRKEPERIAAEKAEAERIAAEKAEAEAKSKAEAEAKSKAEAEAKKYKNPAGAGTQFTSLENLPELGGKRNKNGKKIGKIGIVIPDSMNNLVNSIYLQLNIKGVPEFTNDNPEGDLEKNYKILEWIKSNYKYGEKLNTENLEKTLTIVLKELKHENEQLIQKVDAQIQAKQTKKQRKAEAKQTKKQRKAEAAKREAAKREAAKREAAKREAAEAKKQAAEAAEAEAKNKQNNEKDWNATLEEQDIFGNWVNLKKSSGNLYIQNKDQKVWLAIRKENDGFIKLKKDGSGNLVDDRPLGQNEYYHRLN